MESDENGELSAEPSFSTKSVIQFGDFTATLESGRGYFVCRPVNPPLQLKMNLFLDTIRGYRPDRLAYYAEAAAARFGGVIQHLDRLSPDEEDLPGRIY